MLIPLLSIDFFTEIDCLPYGSVYYDLSSKMNVNSQDDDVYTIRSSESSPRDDENVDEENERNNQFKAHANKIKSDDSDDYYCILGLGDLAWNATQEDIKQAYRKLVLLYHPDKVQNQTEDTNKKFLKIQEAFNVLSNPDKRIEYCWFQMISWWWLDMTVRTSLMSPFPLEMSLAISLTSTSPSSSEMLDSVLYNLCIPVYHSLFVIVNRPPLGDATTPYSQVEAFYNFWYMFRSTRTFNSKDEYNPEV